MKNLNAIVNIFLNNKLAIKKQIYATDLKYIDNLFYNNGSYIQIVEHMLQEFNTKLGRNEIAMIIKDYLDLCII